MRHAAAALGINRKTIKRYWDGANTPGERKAYPQRVDSPEKQAVMEAIKKYFEDNKEFSKGKQTINAQTAWKALRDTYHVGESTVRRYVRELKQHNPQAFIPLDFDPGECMEDIPTSEYPALFRFLEYSDNYSDKRHMYVLAL